MNRAERRSYMKQGASKETIDRLEQFNKPCTLGEVVQISRASAEDVVEDYHRRAAPIQMAISMQLEIMKSMLVEAGVISEEKFRELYVKQAEEFNAMANSESTPQENPTMSAKVDTVEVKVER